MKKGNRLFLNRMMKIRFLMILFVLLGLFGFTAAFNKRDPCYTLIRGKNERLKKKKKEKKANKVVYQNTLTRFF